MKKQIYYIPLFLMLFIIMVISFYLKQDLGFIMSAISIFLLAEIYYLKFLK
jgi:hypothetical protein